MHNRALPAAVRCLYSASITLTFQLLSTPTLTLPPSILIQTPHQPALSFQILTLSRVGAGNVYNRAIADTTVYSLADKYDIKDLADHAAHKFGPLVGQLDDTALISAINTVFSTGMGSHDALLFPIIKKCLLRIGTLQEMPAFADIIKQNAELGAILIPGMYEDLSASIDALKSQSHRDNAALSSLRSQNKSLEVRNRHLEASKSQQEEKMEVLKEKVESLGDTVDHHNKQLGEQRKELTRANDTISKLRGKYSGHEENQHRVCEGCIDVLKQVNAEKLGKSARSCDEW